MKTYLHLMLLLVLTATSCGKDESKTSDAIVADEPVAEETPETEDQAPVKVDPTYEAPAVVVNQPAVTIDPPVVVPGPVSEDPIIAAKIQEMDSLIQARVNVLMAWNVWDNYKTKALVNESPSRQTPAHYFQLHDAHPFMKVNGVYGQESTFMDHYYSWWFGKKVYHCGELVDSTDSELYIEYAGRPEAERSKLYIQVYFYTPAANGPIYITKIKLNWKFSNGVEQESVKEARCQ